MTTTRPNPLRYVAWLLALLAGTIMLGALTVDAHAALDDLTASVFARVGSILGFEITAAAEIIHLGKDQMQVAFGCNGVLAYCVLLSATLPFPCDIKSKCLMLLLGIPYIFIINQMRLILLAIIMVFLNDKSQFDFYHAGVGQPFAMMLVLLYFVGWLHWGRPKLQDSAAQPTPS
ncbi:MAG: exosortase/archaeosortase family protein [Rhodothermales bacterium]|jgi:exosortase/archaeosortase family protein